MLHAEIERLTKNATSCSSHRKAAEERDALQERSRESQAEWKQRERDLVRNQLAAEKKLAVLERSSAKVAKKLPTSRAAHAREVSDLVSVHENELHQMRQAAEASEENIRKQLQTAHGEQLRAQEKTASAVLKEAVNRAEKFEKNIQRMSKKTLRRARRTVNCKNVWLQLSRMQQGWKWSLPRA